MKQEFPCVVYDLYDEDGKWMTCTANLAAIERKVMGAKSTPPGIPARAYRAHKRTLTKASDIGPVPEPKTKAVVE